VAKDCGHVPYPTMDNQGWYIVQCTCGARGPFTPRGMEIDAWNSWVTKKETTKPTPVWDWEADVIWGKGENGRIYKYLKYAPGRYDRVSKGGSLLLRYSVKGLKGYIIPCPPPKDAEEWDHE